VQVLRELVGHRVGPEQSAGHARDLVDRQRRNAQASPPHGERQAGEHGGQRRYAGKLLVAVGDDQRQLLGRIGGQKAQELEGALVGPVQILQHADGGAERDEQLPEGAEDPVALRSRVAQGGGRRRQEVRELGQDLVERPGHRAQGAGGRSRGEPAERPHDGAERERLAEPMTVTDQDARAADRRGGDHRAHQGALAHSRLTLDEDQGRRIARGLEQEPELPLAPDQARRRPSRGPVRVDRGRAGVR